MEQLTVILDSHQVPAYGLPFPVRSNIASNAPTSVISLNIPDNTTQQSITVPPGASYCVYGSTGDVFISPVSFSIPTSGQIKTNAKEVLNFPPLFEVVTGQSLYLRTPDVNGAFVTLSFYSRGY